MDASSQYSGHTNRRSQEAGKSRAGGCRAESRRRRDAELVGKRHRLHHALRFATKCGELLARRLPHRRYRRHRASKTVASYNYHRRFPSRPHRDADARQDRGKRLAVAIDEEISAEPNEKRRAAAACMPACHLRVRLWQREAAVAVRVSEIDSPFARTPGARFRRASVHERIPHAGARGLVQRGCALSTLPIPSSPREVGRSFRTCRRPQSAAEQDVVLDAAGLIFM